MIGVFLKRKVDKIRFLIYNISVKKMFFSYFCNQKLLSFTLTLQNKGENYDNRQKNHNAPH